MFVDELSGCGCEFCWWEILKNNFFGSNYQNPWKIFLGKECKDDYSKKIIPVCEYNTSIIKKSFFLMNTAVS